MKPDFTPRHWRVSQPGDVPFLSAGTAVAVARRSAEEHLGNLPWYENLNCADVAEHRASVFAVAEQVMWQGELLWYGAVIVLPFPFSFPGASK